MAFDYINEAFKRLDILEEQMFDTSLDGINKLSDFMDEDDTDEVIRVIDPEANTVEDIQDSYVGKVIINCNVCRSHIFENKDDIKIEEDGAVNIEKQCPYCAEQEGFTIVGEIAPFNNTPTNDDSQQLSSEDDAVGESSEDSENNNISEDVSVSRATRRLMHEDFKEVSITTEDQHLEMMSDDNGKVTVITEPVVTEASTTEDTIVPVSDETEDEILANNEVDTASIEDEEDVDFDFDEMDEEGFDELGESYLRRVYENVTSFKTTDVSATDNSLIVEGLISFESGAKKKTGFMFEAKDVNTRGQLRFTGSNKHFTEAHDAFSLVGKIDNKKLFVESLKYNYTVDGNTIRGVARRK